MDAQNNWENMQDQANKKKIIINAQLLSMALSRLDQPGL